MSDARSPLVSCQAVLNEPGERAQRAERRTRAVVLLTVVTMVAEVVGGFVSHSLALLADGFHMATHAGALGLAAFAYWFARTRQSARDFSFGTGKVYALAGYTNAVALVIVAVLMVVEAIKRLVAPEPVNYVESLPVAVVGLLVNIVSAALLHPGHEHHEHEHERHDHGHHDHNLAAAYAHVIADALTSVLAIAALAGGWAFGWAFLDPMVALVGAVVIIRWAIALCRSAARQLLDAVPSHRLVDAIRDVVERDAGSRVLDLHVWELAPGQHGCVIALASSEPRETSHYRDLILKAAALAHLTVEVHHLGRAQAAHPPS